MKQLLLLLSGLEENPGPAQANVDAEKCDIEEWKMNEVPEEDVVIQNQRTKCAVCGVGDLKLDNKVQIWYIQEAVGRGLHTKSGDATIEVLHVEHCMVRGIIMKRITAFTKIMP